MQEFRQLLRFSNSHRLVTVCIPYEHGSCDDFVLFCADGQSTAAFATEFFSVSPRKSSVWFIGIDSCLSHRNAEYVIGRDEQRFSNHETFWVETVWQWLGQEFGLALARENVGVFGYSCGGSFAVSMGTRHPELFGTALAFSVAGRPVSEFDHMCNANISDSEFHLRAGSREPKAMRSYMQRLHRWLGKNGASSDYQISAGGHEFGLWSRELNAVLKTIYLRRK